MSLIKKLLGAPDKEKQNPIYKKAAPMKLYLESRVLLYEDTTFFKDYIAKNSEQRIIKS